MIERLFTNSPGRKQNTYHEAKYICTSINRDLGGSYLPVNTLICVFFKPQGIHNRFDINTSRRHRTIIRNGGSRLTVGSQQLELVLFAESKVLDQEAQLQVLET
jgi:hypothetical protein